MGVEVSLVLTKCDLISDTRKSYLLDKFEKWGYQVKILNLQKSDCFKNILQAIQKAHELSTTTMKERMNDLTGGLNLNLPGFDNSDS